MSVGVLLEEEFINYICLSLPDLHRDTGSSVSVLKNKLRIISFKIRGECDRDLNGFIKVDPESGSIHLKIMLGKLNRIEKDLFDKREDGIFYVHNNANLKINKNGKPFSNYAFWIYEYCQDLITLFEDQIEELKFHIINEKSVNIQSLIKENIKHPTEKKVRSSPKHSFELMNPDVNLNAVQKILEENKFIQKIDFANFKKAFSGEDIKQKVVWENANALRYFINSVYKLSLKNAIEGKYKRAVKCFKSPTKDFVPSDLKNTKNPAATTTFHLDKAIKILNKS